MKREEVAFYALAAAATSSAIVLAWQRRRHAPVAILLAGGLGGDMVQRGLAAVLVGQPRPFTGVARVAWTVKEAIFTAYVPGVVAVALLVLLRARRQALLLPSAAWGAIVAAHVFGYPELRGTALASFYRDVQIAAVVALGAMVARFEVQRRLAHRAPTTTELVVVWAAATEAMNLGGPYLVEPWSRWGLARVAYGVFYVVASIVQIIEGGSAWTSGKRTEPPCSSG